MKLINCDCNLTGGCKNCNPKIDDFLLDQSKNAVVAIGVNPTKLKDFIHTNFISREEVLKKINEDYKGRDITIYELGDWIEKLKSLK